MQMQVFRRSVGIGLFLVFLFLSCVALAGEKDKNKAPVSPHKPLDIVFCLDLSGSTNGLIDDLRDQLWMIINQAQHMEPKPFLRLGVVGFSRPSFGKENAYVKVLVPLTTNFDYLAAELYKLRPSIEKGDQIVSAALRACLNDMKWTDRADAVKLVFLVGNGMVSGNDHEYVRWCEQARERNIVIHTLYVMKSANWFKELAGWRRIATITGGMQTEITVNKPENMQVFVSVKKDLSSLNNRINATYLWAGRDSAVCRRSLSAADSGAFYADDKDVFLNRLYFRAGDEYAVMYNDCDMVSNAAALSADTSAEFDGGAYRERMKEMFQARELLRAELRKEFDPGEIDKMRQAFLSGSIEDAGVLRRCVLNLLFRSWGMR
jgi:hypothetical protein